MTVSIAERIAVTDHTPPSSARVLTREALEFVAALHRRFNPLREQCLAARAARQVAIDDGVFPELLAETAGVREAEWSVAPASPGLVDRRVEITGPVDRKMMINALNSGASCFMADLEDALSPTWENVVEGHANLIDAVRGTLAWHHPDGREYRLVDRPATLLVRPRGWHLREPHVRVDGEPVSASLFDFGLFVFHNAREQIVRGVGPYLYLPKLESHLEARLWNDVFVHAQESLGIPRGTVRATVLIETILAAFEMEEILYELREHAAGLNAGRWDYIFSIIKKFRAHAAFLLPDRAQVTMTVPFMRAYSELLVHTCHRRGAHAIGGMAAFVPSRRDAEANAAAVWKVREDKLRESGDGFDGTWVAHPDLVPVARDVFDHVLGPRPHQKERRREDVHVEAAQLLDVHVPGGAITRDGVRANIDVALQYLGAWLRGDGAVAINHLMEDTATAEIARAQLWQWIHHEAVMRDGEPITRALYREMREAESATLARREFHDGTWYTRAAELLDQLVLDDAFTDFLTVPGYRYLTGTSLGATA